ncbi:unnamed protein product [Caenorhabditis sp. 36 PRJEB53466]|nr:unnamed protein product [Caenorhabditis sp. 36 PRJEB53466]
MICLSFWHASLCAILTSLKTDYVPDERELLRGFIIRYGSSRFRCNSTIPFPVDGLPSILNLFELNVIGNVLFRYATCIPIVIRIFHAITLRNLLRHEYSSKFSNLHKVMADSMPVFTALETLALGLFSIVTVHEDFPEANRFFKIVFAMASVVNMLATTIVMFAFSSDTGSALDSGSIGIKLLCLFVYAYFMPQYIQFHQSSITFPICHSYMPWLFAMMEYSIIVAYALFHLTFLVDIRHVSFVCFPRSSSGECEPIDPLNYRKGAKYEHCRAFEYNQRRIQSL